MVKTYRRKCRAQSGVPQATRASPDPDQLRLIDESDGEKANPSSACPAAEPPPVVTVSSDDSFATADGSSATEADDAPVVKTEETLAAVANDIPDAEPPAANPNEPPAVEAAVSPAAEAAVSPAAEDVDIHAAQADKNSTANADGIPAAETLAVEERENTNPIASVEPSEAAAESIRLTTVHRQKRKATRGDSDSATADLSPPKKKRRSRATRGHRESDSDEEQFRSKKFASIRAKERYDNFLSRGTIAERMVDLNQEDEWGYIAVINNGRVRPTVTGLVSYVPAVVVEFYANLPDALPEHLTKGVKVFVRGHEYDFSAKSINKFYGLKSLSNTEVKAESEADSLGLEKLAECLTEGNKKSWAGMSTTDLSPRFAALVTIAAYNWIPSTHKNHISVERARLIYKLAHGIRVDVGSMVYKQVMSLSQIQKKDSRWLIFPRCIYGLLERQYSLLVLDGEQFISPVPYKKDIRSGVTFVKKEAAKGRFKSKSKAPSYVGPSKTTVSLSDSEPSASSQPVCQRTTRVSVGTANSDATVEALDAILRALRSITKSVKTLHRSMIGGESAEGADDGASTSAESG